ncbi:hypothetical protein SJI19_08490 [Acerihabitans sp. TG2]|uniref:hypothetical protein n=1 Tax=Acerihabitans sp. TG2 TaxID=3096008 RepID=UPI002B236288|nr:hypothetical protein [Acerihabitans sp. TG2]MEA9390578.1 hypothetical protein [Acerihabitans sp. TG2]
MPSINQYPTQTIPVKTPPFGHIKKIMCKSFQLVKRTIGISNSTAKLSRVKRSQCIENVEYYEDVIDINNGIKVTKISAQGEIFNDATNNKAAKDILLVFKNQDDMGNTSSHLNDKAAVTLTKFTLLEKTDDAGLSRDAFINEVAKNIVQKLQTDEMPTKAKKIEWQAQEFATYIPAQINRTIDSAAPKQDSNGKKFLNDKFNKEKIIQGTLADLGLTQDFSQVKNLADKAQPSITHATMNYIALNKIANTELTASISRRVYEIIFNCPGQIEQVTHSAEKIIKQAIAAS